MESAEKSVKILFFGSLAEITGKNEIQMPAKDLDELRMKISEQWPGIMERKIQFAVNECLIRENKPLAEGDLVAVMPPFAGG